jgi:serine/threonine protein kinase/tetratricopeptide (TPR) repeat protein
VNAAFGRYRLLERLGQGGLAEVFKAKSYGVEGFEKTLVIKRFLPELAHNQDFVETFIHEATLAVRLSHANIVQVFDLGKVPAGATAADGVAYFIAMEYVHGLDLASFLARARRERRVLPVQLGVYVASELAKGLDHAHRRRDEQMRLLGIVHRDLSPQNVLLSFEGEVKITDFGIAGARGAVDGSAPEDTVARKLRGNFGAMSPEQALGESVDARSDLFSLGAILYECVAGVHPFSAPTTFETLRRVQACDFPPVELLRPDVPAELVAILRTAMARRSEDRFADAGRMYEALLAFLYAQGSRFGAHHLAESLAGFRDSVDEVTTTVSSGPMLDPEPADSGTERTPLDLPSPRQTSSVRLSSGPRLAPIERAVDLGEHREVTALVLELPRDPDAASMDKAASLVERWGGLVRRREDGHLATLFGLGDPDGRDTEMATRCALVVLRSLETVRPLGAGLHTGRIHLSSSGEATEDDQLDALFDNARDLARVREGHAAMSLQAMRPVKALLEFEPLGQGDRPAASVSGILVKDVRGPGEAFGRFVGRKSELRRIGEVLAIATQRSGRVLTLRGGPGVGKTRLLYEVERRLRKGGYNVGFHIAACPPRGNEFPLSGVVGMLQVLCGTAEGDAQEHILSTAPRLRALGLEDDEVSAVLVALASVPSFSGNSRALLRSAFARMVQSLCEDRPQTYAWDVAHSMDEESFAVIDEAFQRLRHARVVVLFASRAGFSHRMETAEGHVSLELGDLAPADVERLIALRLGVDSAPEELLRFVRARAGGHPLFVEEVVKGLVDAGAVAVSDRRVVSMKLVGHDLTLPKPLRGLVASRVARFSGEDRATLQAASVLGDPVEMTVLSNMLEQDLPSLERSVAALKDADLLVQTGPGELRFASPLIQEIVADALTCDALREMHAAAARALETTPGGRAQEQAGRIAEHLYEAGDRQRAAAYFARSGARRLETRQLEAAARDYAQAIALVDPSKRPPEELAKWLEKLASAVRLVRFVPDAVELCSRVIERMDEAGERDARVRARVSAGVLLAAVQHMEASRQRLAEAEVIAQNDQALITQVVLAEAELAIRQGDFKRTLARLEGIRGAASDDAERHRIALHLAQAHGGLGDRRSALASLEEAQGLLPGDRLASLERTKVRALVDYFTRDFRSAALHCEKAVDLGRELGVGYEVMLNLHNLGDTLVRLNDLPHSYGAFRQSLALCEEPCHERLASYNRMFLAFLDGIQGTVDGATLLRQGIAYAEGQEFTADVIGGRVLLAGLLDWAGKLDEARGEYEKTRDLAIAAGHRLVADDCESALRKLEPTMVAQAEAPRPPS